MARLLTLVLLFIAATAQAQRVDVKPAAQSAPAAVAPAAQTPSGAGTIDLSRDPQPEAAPARAPQPNPGLLLPAGQSGPQTYRTVQTTGPNGTAQPVNATSTQFNLGGQKATNTIYYDNTGKMTGSGTSISIGGR